MTPERIGLGIIKISRDWSKYPRIFRISCVSAIVRLSGTGSLMSNRRTARPAKTKIGGVLEMFPFQTQFEEKYTDL